MVVASSIWVTGPDSASVPSTPHARGDSPSGSSRSMARACAACCTTNSSWPTRPVCRFSGADLRTCHLPPRLSCTLAETGLTASTAFSVTPEKVAAATLRAIDTPRAEIVVSVGPGRLLQALMDLFPGLGPAINHLSGADKLMASVADHREAARTDPARRPHPGPV